jgi:thiol-disulfide isomerase/thioredoxin
VKLGILVVAAGAAFSQTLYRGTLEPELFVPGGLYERVELRESGYQIRGAKALFVEPATLYVDVNGDGRFSADEKYDLSGGVAEINFPVAGSAFKSYPVRVYLSPERTLGESPRAFVRGRVSINGSVSVGFAFDWKTNSVSPNNGWQGFNDEYSFVDEQMVYRAGGAYVRVRSVDLERREFVLESASVAEYTRIDLRVGETFPDFAFADLDGNRHRLSDYGRTLLDFWATWCAPCIADLPRLRELNSHGLRIIGMNVDHDPGKARALNLPWLQAEFGSIRELVERRARIQAYPTYVLLDEQRRIVSIGEDAINCNRCDPSSLSPHVP